MWLLASVIWYLFPSDKNDENSETGKDKQHMGKMWEASLPLTLIAWIHKRYTCCSSICTLVQFVFVPVQNILNWYKIFCASPIFNFIVQFVVNLQYSFIFWSTCLPWISFSSTVVSFRWQSSLVTFHKPEPRVSVRVRKDSVRVAVMERVHVTGLGKG